MSLLHECPNCLKYKIGVPLEEKDRHMVCPVCESIYGKTQNILPKK
jgi:uncharacterized Zn finger protein (UPF0148 family)